MKYDLTIIMEWSSTLDGFLNRIPPGWRVGGIGTRWLSFTNRDEDSLRMVDTMAYDGYHTPPESDPIPGFPNHLEKVRYFDMSYDFTPETRKLLIALTDAENLWVDLKHGDILKGTEFAELARTHPDWDWNESPRPG